MNGTDTMVLRFGEGKISGILSAVLGLMSLAGVLCFHFPTILTTPALTQRVGVEHLRLLLTVVMAFAFALGLINFMIGRNRELGLLGMISTTVTQILGGASVQVGAAAPHGLLPLGMDALLLGLLFNALLFIPIEKLFPLRRDQPVFRSEWKVDFSYFAVTNLLASVLMAIVTASGPALVGWLAVSPIHDWVRSRLPIVQFGMMALVADLAQYWIHRAFHTPRLWPLHAIHHSTRTMDWLAGSRLHLLEVLCTRVSVFLPLYWLGFPQDTLYAYIGFVSIHAVFIHANVGINFGILRYLLATPQFHHWHHTDEPEYADKNFAVHFPVLDLIFGTHHQPRGKWPQSYGVIGEYPPSGMLAQHVHALRRVFSRIHR